MILQHIICSANVLEEKTIHNLTEMAEIANKKVHKIVFSNMKIDRHIMSELNKNQSIIAHTTSIIFINCDMMNGENHLVSTLAKMRVLRCLMFERCMHYDAEKLNAIKKIKKVISYVFIENIDIDLILFVFND